MISAYGKTMQTVSTMFIHVSELPICWNAGLENPQIKCHTEINMSQIKLNTKNGTSSIKCPRLLFCRICAKINHKTCYIRHRWPLEWMPPFYPWFSGQNAIVMQIGSNKKKRLWKREHVILWPFATLKTRKHNSVFNKTFEKKSYWIAESAILWK